MVEDNKDYAGSGMSIQYALLDQMKRFPDKAERPEYLLLGGLKIKTGDRMLVPGKGFVQGEFLQCKGDVEQGYDLDADPGLKLGDGKIVKVLRTWYFPDRRPVPRYQFFSKDGVLWIWNVFKQPRGRSGAVEEKWTGNAGFWVEIVSPLERVYHCSHGMADPPDFESLVFRITVFPGT